MDISIVIYPLWVFLLILPRHHHHVYIILLQQYLPNIEAIYGRYCRLVHITNNDHISK